MGKRLLSGNKGHQVPQKSLAFIGISFSAIKDTRSWGKVTADICVETSVSEQLSPNVLI